MTLEALITLLITNFPQFSIGIIFIAFTVQLFKFLMDANSQFRQYLIDDNKRLNNENKELRQALFSINDQDKIRLATALISKSPQTNLGDE